MILKKLLKKSLEPIWSYLALNSFRTGQQQQQQLLFQHDGD